MIYLVQFTWPKKYDSDPDDPDDPDAPYYEDISKQYLIDAGIFHCTNPTIWIGVTPNTLTSTVAHDFIEEICVFLDSLEVRDVDIAYYDCAVIHWPYWTH